MKLLITGAHGQLGRRLLTYFQPHYTVIPANRPDFDLSQPQTIRELVNLVRPTVVIHCAALPDVDYCHQHPKEAHLINTVGTQLLAEACKTTNSRLIYISTDYVFRGDTNHPYSEDAPTLPETIYGQSKLAAEQATQEILPENSVICRTSWHYAANGHGFLQKMLRDAYNPDCTSLEAIADQYGSPTSTEAIAVALEAIVMKPEVRGVLHVSTEGATTRYDFARELLKLLKINKSVIARSLSDDPRPGKRPAYTVLAKNLQAKWGLPEMPTWQDDLKNFIARHDIRELF